MKTTLKKLLKPAPYIIVGVLVCLGVAHTSDDFVCSCVIGIIVTSFFF